MGKMELEEIKKLLKQLQEYKNIYEVFDKEISVITTDIEKLLKKPNFENLDYLYSKQRIVEEIKKIKNFSNF